MAEQQREHVVNEVLRKGREHFQRFLADLGKTKVERKEQTKKC